MSDKGVLTVISGFSGAGKGTVVKQLLEKYDYGLSISATTRSPREGEQDGREYFFKTKEDQRQFREKSMISHVHYQWKRHSKIAIPVIDELIVPLLQSKKLWSNRIPQMIAGYFYDLYTCLMNLTNNINDGAILGLVVGNPTYAGVVVATDMILADIATTLGYTCLGIQIYRRVVPSSQQTKLIEPEDQKYVRESLVVLQWKKK